MPMVGASFGEILASCCNGRLEIRIRIPNPDLSSGVAVDGGVSKNFLQTEKFQKKWRSEKCSFPKQNCEALDTHSAHRQLTRAQNHADSGYNEALKNVPAREACVSSQVSLYIASA
jgi:hypothetical protein